MKKRYLVIPAALLLLTGMYIGSESKPKITSSVKNDIIMRSKNFIQRLHRRDYHSCYTLFDERMKASMSEERLKATFDRVLDSLGDFVRFKSVSISSHEAFSDEFIICSIKCEYANGSASYTISFNKELEIGGLYIK